MAPEKFVKKNEKIGLKLTEAQRTLILERLTCLPPKYEQALRSTSGKTPVMLTLDELDDLGGYVAAEANHAKDERRQKKLDGIFQKIQRLLETHTDEQPPQILKIEDAREAKLQTEQSVRLAEWAAQILIGAEKLGIKSKPVTRFPVSGVEREVLAMIKAVPTKVRKKLSADSPNLTIGEVGSLLIAVAEATLDANPLQRFSLIMVAGNLMNCLEQEVIALADLAENENP